MAEVVAVSRELLEALVDADECWFDHHGGCQAHRYLDLQSGEKCPQQELKELLSKRLDALSGPGGEG
jgi:hypothetical protein